MTLDDFFTLADGKDGHISPARIDELNNIMQKEKDCIVKNVSDTSQQWCTVVNTIVAAKNQYCLDLFIQLDGLWFIDRWLKDAQNLNNSDGFVEEKITALLKALEKLHIDSNRSISSGIWFTVKNLCGHASHVVQNSARALFDMWKLGGDDDIHNKNEELHDVETFTHASVPKQSINEENHSSESACNDVLREKHVNWSGKIQDVEVQALNGQVNSHVNLMSCDVDSRPFVEKSSLMTESRFPDTQVKTYTYALMKTPNSVMEPDLQKKLDDKDGNATDSITRPASEMNHCKIKPTFHAPDETGGFSSSILGKNEDSNSASLEQVSKFNEHTGSEEEIFHRASDYLRPARAPPADKKHLWMADMGLEYGLVDALAVARKVAEEVEREVNYKEISRSSSSQKSSHDGIRQPSSPDSINDRKQFILSDDEKNGQNLSPEASHSITKSENVGDNPENYEHDIESSQHEASAEKGLLDFDLNEDFCSEETEHSMNRSITATVSVVFHKSSIPPLSPLQFEEALGWNGSAATSADKQKLNFLDFDLNVAETGENQTTDSLGVEQIPAQLFPGLPSGESSLEVSSKRSKKLNFDLNCVGDEKYALPSPASSSSRMLHPPIRNIDLNGPSISHDSSVISLMGTRVEVGRKESASQELSMLPNGKMSIETSVGRTGGFFGLGPTAQYRHHNDSPPGFRLNGNLAGPAMSFSPAIYGPSGSIPYMMNSNGVIPSSSVSPYSQPQFMMSMNGGLTGITAAGPSRTSFDMNSGFVGEGGLRQFFGDSEGKLMVNSPEGFISGYGGKRKEPEMGWDLYPFSSKHQLPWK